MSENYETIDGLFSKRPRRYRIPHYGESGRFALQENEKNAVHGKGEIVHENYNAESYMKKLAERGGIYFNISVIEPARAEFFFDTAKYDLTKESIQEIKRLAQEFDASPELKINIRASTDTQGTEENNKILSVNRANAVIGELKKQYEAILQARHVSDQDLQKKLKHFDAQLHRATKAEGESYLFKKTMDETPEQANRTTKVVLANRSPDEHSHGFVAQTALFTKMEEWRGRIVDIYPQPRWPIIKGIGLLYGGEVLANGIVKDANGKILKDAVVEFPGDVQEIKRVHQKAGFNPNHVKAFEDQGDIVFVPDKTGNIEHPVFSYRPDTNEIADNFSFLVESDDPKKVRFVFNESNQRLVAYNGEQIVTEVILPQHVDPTSLPVGVVSTRGEVELVDLQNQKELQAAKKYNPQTKNFEFQTTLKKETNALMQKFKNSISKDQWSMNLSYDEKAVGLDISGDGILTKRGVLENERGDLLRPDTEARLAHVVNRTIAMLARDGVIDTDEKKRFDEFLRDVKKSDKLEDKTALLKTLVAPSPQFGSGISKPVSKEK